MIKVAIAVAAVFATLPLHAQNLLVNPGFDVADQLTGWTCTSTYGTAAWSPTDRLGSAASGSVMVDVSAKENNKTVWCVQCVPVDELQSYVASGWYFWPNDTDVSQLGSSRWSVYYYDNTDCTGDSVVGANATGNHPQLDTWYFLATDESIAPTGKQSALVFFITWQNLGDQYVRALMDDLDFSIPPFFQDGFETGGMGEWSTAVP